MIYPAISLALFGLGLHRWHVAAGLPPTAGDVIAATNEDAVASIALSGSGTGTLVYLVSTPPLHGSAEVSRSRITYTPETDYNGADSLQYRVQDGTGAWSGTATVSITITPVNDPPVATAQSVITESSEATEITLTGTDVDGDAVTTCTLEGAATHGRARLSGCTVTYTSDNAYVGPDSFTFTVSDGHVASAAADVTIDVQAPNQPPVANPTTLDTDEDTPGVVTLTGTDPEGAPLTFLISNNGNHGTAVLVGDQVTYTPDENWSGTDSFKFKAVDNAGATSAGATVSVAVSPVNDAPVAPDQSNDQDEDTPDSIRLIASDEESHSGFTYTLVELPSHGIAEINNAIVQYTPDPDFNGTDTFTWRVNDGEADSLPGTVTLTVNPVPDAPVACAAGGATIQDQPVTLHAPWHDGDNDDASVTLVEGGSHGSVTMDGDDLVYTPDPGYYGADTISFHVTDTTGLLSGLGTIRVNVHPTPIPGRAEMPQYGFNQIHFGLDATPGEPLSTASLQYRPETIFGALDALGIQTYRQLQSADLVWSSLEPGDGVFADAESEEVLAWGEIEPEVTLFEIQYASPTPPWCSDKSDFQKFMGTDAYRYLDHIIDYFGDQVRYYEVGNEVYHWTASEPPQSEAGIESMPDCYPVDGYWPAEQAVFLEEASRYIKIGDPDAIITLPAINNNDDLSNDWMREVIRTAPDTEWFDIVAYHSYVSWSKLYSIRPALTELVQELGIDSKMIKMTEGGTSSDPEKTKKTDYPNSEETQASDIFRLPVISWGFGDAAFIWHSYIAAPANEDGSSFSCEVVNSDGTWRPSAYTVQLMTENLLPFKEVADYTVGGQYRFRVTTTADETRWVVWGEGHLTVPAGVTEWTPVLPDLDGNFGWADTSPGELLDLTETPILLR